MDMSSTTHAKYQDEQDPLRRFRDLFLIPTKADLARTTLKDDAVDRSPGEPCIYLCGNSLGLQPTLTRTYLEQYLNTWKSKGVYGHFKTLDDSNLVPWMHVDEDVQEDMAKIVGGMASEVAVMQTLTMNLHLMMASFFQPSQERWKIILEGKAFPSDHYAVESQLRHHGLDVESSMILIEPPSEDSPLVPTDHVISIIDQHASETALLLLPGIQFYTGQLFDMQKITCYAQSKGIIVGWDLAHAVGNVPLQMHEWNVDFAVWCTYKYLNCGPGAIGGCFVHERHGKVASADGAGPNGTPKLEYRPRLSGWWGSAKSSRFAMTNMFEPTPGAGGFQISNPSVADTTAVRASLDIFKQTSMTELRKKSVALTKYLEDQLNSLAVEQDKSSGCCFSIITSRKAEERGAQLSVRLKPGMLESVVQSLEEDGVVVDERRPDVIRVAPAPLYNTFSDVFYFVNALRQACEKAMTATDGSAYSAMADVGKDSKGWSDIK